MFLEYTLLGAAKGALDSCGFFEAAMLYMFAHIPKNAYAILASPFKEGCRMPTMDCENDATGRSALSRNPDRPPRSFGPHRSDLGPTSAFSIR